jgi:chemotaxis protein CheD
MDNFNMVRVGMADLNIAHSPDALTTLGLGSCVGVCLYDSYSKVAGMAHIMLPSSQLANRETNLAKFADTAIEFLIEKMVRSGARKTNLVAKLAGGAQMFKHTTENDIIKIGYKNVIACKEILQQLNIRIIAEDTGGHYGRTIEFFAVDGRLSIKSIGIGVKEI